jgi:glycosyltransferase involved in cell wall biosynthesis
MKIVYNTNAVIPSRSAHSIHVMKMCEAFAYNGHEVVLVAPSWGDQCEGGIDDICGFYGVDRCFDFRTPSSSMSNFGISGGSRGRVYATFLATMENTLRRVQPDIVYGRFACGCLLAAVQGHPVIFESHVPIWEGHRLEKIFFEGLIRTRRFVRLIVISQALKEMYLSAGYLSDEAIRVAHDGAVGNRPVEPLDEWPGRAGHLQVGYTGHLYHGRGIDVILELGRRLPDVDFHVVGGMPTDVQHWNGLGNTENVFLHGYVMPKRVRAYVERCDVLLAPYQERVMVAGGKLETSRYMSPMKVFEYMSSNKPIVASDLPVVREVLNERNAILVPPGDVAAWRQALIRLHSPSLRRELSERAYLDFTTHYQWSQRARRVLRESACPSVSD